MSEAIRYLASYTPYEGLDLNGQCARHDGDYFVSASDFDRVTAERDGLQQRLTAADDQLDDCGQFEQRQIAVIQEFSQQVELLMSLLKRCQAHLPGYALALRNDVDSSLKVDEVELLK